jgi:ribosomal protein S11
MQKNKSTAVDAIRTVGLQRAEVMVKGAGSGRDATLRINRAIASLLIGHH